jgi:hypothetical protein
VLGSVGVDEGRLDVLALVSVDEYLLQWNGINCGMGEVVDLRKGVALSPGLSPWSRISDFGYFDRGDSQGSFHFAT